MLRILDVIWWSQHDESARTLRVLAPTPVSGSSKEWTLKLKTKWNLIQDRFVDYGVRDHFDSFRDVPLSTVDEWTKSTNTKVGRRIEGGKKTGKRGNPETKRKSCPWILKEFLVIEAQPWNIGVLIKKALRKILRAVQFSGDSSLYIKSTTSNNKDVSLIEKWWGNVAAVEEWWERIVIVGI